MKKLSTGCLAKDTKTVSSRRLLGDTKNHGL